MSTAQFLSARGLAAAALFLALLGWAPTARAQEKSMPQQIADVMVQLNGGIHPGFRFAHAKGLVLTGTSHAGQADTINADLLSFLKA
jgi:hypothetical protein